MAGPEFGPEQGNVMLFVGEMFGLNSSGEAFRALLAEQSHELDYRPSVADPDVWIIAPVKPNEFMNYEYVI